MNDRLIKIVRDIYQTTKFIPFHALTYSGNENDYVVNSINSTFGQLGAVSFNGNKIITKGGVLSQDFNHGIRTKHVTTTANVPHPFEFYHDEVSVNYRLPNLNAALGCAQMEVLPTFLLQKRKLAQRCRRLFVDMEYKFIDEPEYTKCNCWLNTVICLDSQSHNTLIEQTYAGGIMTRLIWQLRHRLSMLRQAKRGPLPVPNWVESCLVNIPGSPVAIG